MLSLVFVGIAIIGIVSFLGYLGTYTIGPVEHHRKVEAFKKSNHVVTQRRGRNLGRHARV